MFEGAKLIGAGCATIALAGAGAGIGIVFWIINQLGGSKTHH